MQAAALNTSMPESRDLDLLTFGETMVRFSVPATSLLSDASNYEVHSAGAEGNVAAAVARMGFRSAWYSELPDHTIGHRVVQTLQLHGVDCSHVRWRPQGRVGVYYLEMGSSPRPTRVIYDRKDSTASRMSVEQFDWSLLSRCRVIHLTGITAALSPSCYELVREAIRRSNELGVKIVFDVNFRALLWSADVCRSQLEPLISRVDTLLISLRDAKGVFGFSGSDRNILTQLQSRYGLQRVAMTIGERGALGVEGAEIYEAPGWPVTIVDRIGAGDSFAAGMICGLLEDSFAKGLDYGVAMSALKLTIAGDIFRLRREDVLALIQKSEQTLIR